MDAADQLQRGRDSFRRKAWGDAYAELSSADQRSALGPEDLERLAVAAYLLGRDTDSDDFWARAHNEFLARDDRAHAARCAFWLALGLFLKGEMARGGGWFARAQRLLDERQQDCVELGYLCIPGALQSVSEGDYSSALATLGEITEIADRFGDPDLQVMVP